MSSRKTTVESQLNVVGSQRSKLRFTTLAFLALFVLIVAVLVAADVAYLVHWKVSPRRVREILFSTELLYALRLSLITSITTLLLVMCCAVPIGYALSRYRFPGHALVNTVVDVPIVLPPVVIGLSLLAFFGTPLGAWIKMALKSFNISLISGVGIVMCQFLVSVSYCIRATKSSFDSVDRQLEHVALSLGCSPWAAFRRVTLPLARNGLIAGGVMAWARAIGVFGPLMVFVGTGPRVQVMPTNMWLELNVGNIEVALVVALVTMLLAGAALLFVHRLAPGRTWT